MEDTRPRAKLQGREITILAATAAVGLAVALAFVTGNQMSGITGRVDNASSASAGFLRQVGAVLPFGYAFAAGMVASVNPCGFALLPAYLGMYLGTGERRGGLGRAAQIGVAVTVGFVLVFGLTGILFDALTVGIASFFPWIGLVVGLLLVVVGARMLGGHELYAGFTSRIAERIGPTTRAPGLRGYLAYGVLYAATSLGCTLPIYLTVLRSSLTGGGFLSSAVSFLLYALGMGFVVTVLTVSVALFKQALVHKVRAVSPYVHTVSAVLMLLTGAYIIYYWLTIGELVKFGR